MSIIIRVMISGSLLLAQSDRAHEKQEHERRDQNLLRKEASEHGRESVIRWVEKQTGSNNATFGIFDWTAYGLDQVLYVKVTEYESGEAGWEFKPIHATPGHRYIWTSTFRKEGPSVIRAEFKLKSGERLVQDLDLLEWDATDNWVTVTEEFVAPPHAIAVSISHCLIGQGVIYSDEISLAEE